MINITRSRNLCQSQFSGGVDTQDAERAEIYAAAWQAVINERPGKLLKLVSALWLLGGGVSKSLGTEASRQRSAWAHSFVTLDIKIVAIKMNIMFVSKNTQRRLMNAAATFMSAGEPPESLIDRARDEPDWRQSVMIGGLNVLWLGPQVALIIVAFGYLS